MVDLPAITAAITQKNGILAHVYADLAQPGVRQVGKALETVLQTGNILLLPLRLLNETAKSFEIRSFKEIAERFSKIPEEDIVDVRPEIGNPIMDRLSITEDPTLRAMFVELLAKAADRSSADCAHPSFTKVIENITPDEAKLLEIWRDHQTVAYIEISQISNDTGGMIQISPLAINPPKGLIQPSMCPVYISNLSGLGILNFATDKWFSDELYYSGVVELFKRKYPNLKDISFGSSDNQRNKGDFVFQKGIISILPYGKTFQGACLPPI